MDQGSLDVEPEVLIPSLQQVLHTDETLFWLTRHRNGDYYAHINVSLESL